MNILPEPFIQFLDTLSLESDAGGSEAVEIIRQKNLRFADGRVGVSPAVMLLQDKGTAISIDGFRKKIQQVLRKESHVANDAIADAILGISVGATGDGRGRYAFLNDVLTRFRAATVSHFFILPHVAISSAAAFNGYSLGSLNLEVLSSRCNRAMSDYAMLCGKDLSNRVTLQSPEFKHIVIDFLKPGNDSGLLEQKSWRDLLLNYFEQVSRAHYEFMWSDLNRTQVLAAPFGHQFLDVQNIRSTLGAFANKVTIYLEFSKLRAGYVVPEEGSIILNQPGSESEAFRDFQKHCLDFRLSEIGSSELGELAVTCSGFCQQAIRFLESGRTDDAALYATICLEHLFSEKKSTADAVCSRVAAVTFLRTTNDFAESQRELKRLYDARSAFVHSGKSVTAEQASRLIDYARETIRSLLVLHLKVGNRGPGFLERWNRELEFIAVGILAGKSFEPDFLAEQGVFRK
jgi:hypothetical protein